MEIRKTRPLLFMPPLIFLAIIGLFVFGMTRENATDLPSTMVGRETPPLSLTPLGDFPMVTTEALRGPGVKLLNFWASWCVGCRLEHPVLVKMAEAGGQIYGADYKDDKGVTYLMGKGNPYVAVSQDERGRTGIDWGVYGIPETFIIDGNGNVTHRHIGAITEEVMRDTIMPLMAEAEARS